MNSVGYEQLVADSILIMSRLRRFYQSTKKNATSTLRMSMLLSLLQGTRARAQNRFTSISMSGNGQPKNMMNISYIGDSRWFWYWVCLRFAAEVNAEWHRVFFPGLKKVSTEIARRSDVHENCVSARAYFALCVKLHIQRKDGRAKIGSFRTRKVFLCCTNLRISPPIGRYIRCGCKCWRLFPVRFHHSSFFGWKSHVAHISSLFCLCFPF